MLILTICRVYMYQNGSDRNRFTFLLSLGIKIEKKKLRICQNMAWKAFFCWIIYTNLQNLPYICVKMAPTGTFFHFSCDCWN